MRRLAAVLSIAGSSVVLAGCGGASGEVSPALERLAQAATASADTESGRFEFAAKSTERGGAKSSLFLFTGEGEYDAVANWTRFSYDLSNVFEVAGDLLVRGGVLDENDPSAWKLDVFRDGYGFHIRFPAFIDDLPAGKSWLRADSRNYTAHYGVVSLSERSVFDRREMLDFVRAATGEVSTVGRERLRGVATTRVRTMVDLDAYEELVPEERGILGTMVGVFVDDFELDEVPLDVWLDERGLVRQLLLTPSDETLRTRVRFELFDYGKPVEYRFPAASKVVDAADLD